MGVLNATPDSFSDGGHDADGAASVRRGLAMWESGADIVDVGGESTRPGAEPVSVADEIERVVPVVAALADAGVVVSIDTMKPAVAAAAVTAGAEIINDVSGLRDKAMARLAAESGTGVVIMHMPGVPRTMQSHMAYDDVVGDVASYLAAQADGAIASGVAPERICIDPGIGFGKSHEHSLELLNSVDTFVGMGFPVLIGASRKGFLGAVLRAAGRETEASERDFASAATVSAAIIGGAAVVRVHDVPGALQVALTTDAIVSGQFENWGNIGRT